MITPRPHQEETFQVMQNNKKGKIFVPTGGGKTISMILDVQELFKEKEDKNVVVVSPRIGLSIQLRNEFVEHIDCASIIHVHTNVVKKSDKTENQYFTSTNPQKISLWEENVDGHKIFFTTYHSLRRLEESGVKIHTIYFDEAHNSVRKDFYKFASKISVSSDRCFFFTATPKNSTSYEKPGMNWGETYGNTLIDVPAPELVQNGSIIPPKIVPVEMNTTRIKEMDAEYDCISILDILLNEEYMEKVLIASPSTRVLIRMLAETDFLTEVRNNGYEVFWITAKYGAFINSNKVSREIFFKTLNDYGKDPKKKFIVLHYSILSEGINCPGLSACIMMRQMNIIQTAQMVGRVIRLHPEDSKNIQDGTVAAGDTDNYVKPFGMVYIPVYKNTGNTTVECLENVVDTAFNKGKAPEEVVS
jgi:superfamily II DNA or RNA helicase